MVVALARSGANRYLSELQIEYRDITRRYAIWPDGSIRNVGLCSPSEFDELVVTLLGKRAPYVLRNVDREYWDLYSRWWLLDVLMSERLIKLYGSRDQAVMEI